MMLGAENQPGYVYLRHVYSEERKELELGEDQRAKISIYLASYGKRVDNYVVALAIKDGEFWREIDKKTSEADGIVHFWNVKPGDYLVDLRKTEEQLLSAAVNIGDFGLEVMEAEESYF